MLQELNEDMLFRVKEMLDGLALPIYKLFGCRPWSPGYYTAKKRVISSAIDAGLFKRTEALPPNYGYGLDERVVEYPWLFAQIEDMPGRVLDAGSVLNYPFLVNRPPVENAQLTIMTLAPENRCYWKRSISYVYGDLRKPHFVDGLFDVVVSVSTIEHIGLDNTRLYTDDISLKESDATGFIPAISEFRRVLKSGGVCLLTVPYGKRAVCGWYQVFDAELVQVVIKTFRPAEYAIDYFGYSRKGWTREQPENLADAEFYDILEGKPIDTDTAAAARGVACLRLRT